jgi:hypothetical protein
MTIYGGIEIEYYQLTPMGISRFQSGQVTHLDPASKQVLGEIVELGGTAEIDELKFHGTIDNPRMLKVALSRLVDLGYVVPVTMQE